MSQTLLFQIIYIAILSHLHDMVILCQAWRREQLSLLCVFVVCRSPDSCSQHYASTTAFARHLGAQSTFAKQKQWAVRSMMFYNIT